MQDGEDNLTPLSFLSQGSPDVYPEFPEPKTTIPTHKKGTSNAIRRTIPLLSPLLFSDMRDYHTWSEVKKRQNRNRRWRSDSGSEENESEEEKDTLNDTLARPHSKNFIHSTLVKRLRKPDPTLL